MSEKNSSDSLDQSIDSGIDQAMAAKGAYDTINSGIGAAAAESAKAAAQSAASSGAGAGASSGAAAAAGSAAGPHGTAIGAVVGLTTSLFAKPVIKGIIVIVVILAMIFRSLPSMFFENPVDVADNTGPIEVYAQFKDYVLDKYTEELDRHKDRIERDFRWREFWGEFSDYDYIEFSFSFNPPEDVFMEELMAASTLIIAMFEISTDDWRQATFADFRRAVDRAHFWNDTIAVELAGEEQEVTYSVTYDEDENEVVVRTIHVHQTFDIFDMGVEVFRDRFGLDDRDFLLSVEMAHNIQLFFGEDVELPAGGVTGGGASGSFPGGGTHNTIRRALAELEDRREFFGGSAIIPLPAGTWWISSEFGPRNFAPDPLHTGIDFGAASGTRIYSSMDGIVLLRLTNMRTFGHHIVIYHGGGVTTMYAHMISFGSFAVGDEVRRGDVIGYVGRTGMSTGYHLHFEYQRNGWAFNPRLLLPL